MNPLMGVKDFAHLHKSANLDTWRDPYEDAQDQCWPPMGTISTSSPFEGFLSRGCWKFGVLLTDFPRSEKGLMVKTKLPKMCLQETLWAHPDKSGILMKRGGDIQTWKRRYFVVKDTFLFYFKNRQVGPFRSSRPW
jgi:hypothetical protein